MPYIGNQAVVGDSANTFKTLDGIASFTVTFDATDSSVVSIANNTLTFNNHRFVTGQKVTYNDGGGTAIGGLSDGSYFIIKEDQSTIKLASSASNAAAGTAIDLTSGAAGGSHTLNIAFDGVNTKFKATHTNGIKAKVSRPAQITLSINGVIQQPTADYTIESDSTLVFSSAPESSDKIFASFIGEVAASFDLTDNTVDEFTANGSTTTFTLSKTVPSSNDVLVTLDGVTQYPNTQSATRAYSVLENVLTFTSAPAAGVIIQVRHIGFAGATSQSVTGFYGRTGNVQLKNTDNVAVNNLTVAGNLDVTGDLTYDETVSRNLNVTGVATVASGIVSTGDWKIGTATTLSQDNIFTTGIITAASFSGSGANLTGVASTENIRTNTNAAFLQNISVVGTSTVTGNIVPSSDSATDIGTNSVRFQNAYVDTYYGDGSNLTGIDASTLKSGSDVKAQANASGIVVTGIMTATRGVGIGTTTTTGRNAGVSTVAGTVVYNTDSTSLQVYTGSEWVSVQAADRPSITSISGSPISGNASNLTFSVSNTTSTVTVRYYLTNTDGTLLATTADVSVSSGSFTTAVPAAVYGRSAGDVIAMTIETTDNITSLPSNKTVISLPTGGTITTSGGQRIHTFTSSGNLVFPDGYGSKSATYLIVAGGGSGGNNTSGSFENGGGGGAGGMLTGSTTLANNTTYAIVVGAGGARPAGNANGTTKGSNSTGFSQTAIGGGGGVYNGGVGGSASNGGSGGGAINWNYGNSVQPGTGTSGQGNDGGNGSGQAGTNGGTGGGGGKSSAGESSSGTNAGDGGGGQASSISGSSVTYAGGGGGGGGTGGTGGSGVGGNGGSSSSQAAASGGNGTANRGGGGGGNWWNDGSNDGYGGNGGSGIVIVSYAA